MITQSLKRELKLMHQYIFTVISQLLKSFKGGFELAIVMNSLYISLYLVQTPKSYTNQELVFKRKLPVT